MIEAGKNAVCFGRFEKCGKHSSGKGKLQILKTMLKFSTAENSVHPHNRCSKDHQLIGVEFYRCIGS